MFDYYVTMETNGNHILLLATYILIMYIQV